MLLSALIKHSKGFKKKKTHAGEAGQKYLSWFGVVRNFICGKIKVKIEGTSFLVGQGGEWDVSRVSVQPRHWTCGHEDGIRIALGAACQSW